MKETVKLKIDTHTASTLDSLFRQRVDLTPDSIAYRNYDKTAKQWRDYTWQDMADYVSRWQAALQTLELAEGDRVALILKNSPDWVAVDPNQLGEATP